MCVAVGAKQCQTISLCTNRSRAMQKGLMLYIRRVNFTFEFTMSNLYNYCNVEKNCCKASGSKILWSLEKNNVRISYEEIMQSDDDDDKTHTYINITRSM
jgi:hypothetical protein